jgi:hypothetical protein
MFVKALVGGGALVGLGLYLNGSFSSSYSRDVGATPAEVRSALQDLDIREAPGEPATDPSRSGGIAPMFQLTEEGNDMVWTVMSGDKVAVKMIAHLTPIDGGQHTRVTADVQRGDAPDDLVAPAFRSTGVTKGLFGMVLDQELDELTIPQKMSREECRELMERLLEANAPPPDQQTGFAGVARTGLVLSGVESKLRAAGCPTNPGKFDPVHDEMGSGSPPPMTADEHHDEVNFDPGKPMVDPSHDAHNY